ncbi:MAG: protein kinase [Planctomycetes bacterium]|nr:protein kinase [Planctomycetota bacterium]
MAFTYKHGDRPLSGYEIQRGVGRGGFGEVYYAISDGGREVALKYLREHPEVELRGVAQCINLKSPHLVSIFDVKQNDEGEYFVVMEYISGPSLQDMLIAEPNGLGPQKAAFFTREIAKGLGYLHDRGIVHRDLKPGNIFYDEGYVKICDYGLSKFISVSRHSAQTTSIGTVHYMAPEIGSGNYSSTIDIYALGVVLYEMLMGKVPYEGSSMGEILMKHLTEQPEVDQLPAPFGRVIKRALAKDPKDRYQNVNEMVEDLFDVDDIKKSVMGFEPTSLTMVAAQVADDIRPSPVPSDNPQAAALDPARLRRKKLSGDDFSRRFIERTGGLDPWMTKKERRAERRKRKRDKAPAPELLGKEHEPDDLIRSPYRIGFGRRIGRLFAATLVAGGLATGIGLIGEDADLGLVSFCTIMLSVVGIGLGNKLANWLGPDHPHLIGRLMVLAFAAPAALLVYGVVGQERVGDLGLGADRLHLPLLATFVLFNWRERIRSGLRGEFSIWTGVWTGFLAFVGTGILLDIPDTSGDYEKAACWLGGIAGCITLSLQAFSWAMIRNPKLPSAMEEAFTSESGAAGRATLEQFEVSEQNQRSGPADRASAGAALDYGRAGDLPAQYIRSTVLRIVAGVLAVCATAGIVGLSVCLGNGVFRGNDDTMGAIVGIVALSLSFLFWLGKTTRTKRVSVWSEWFNPILRVGAGTVLATGVSGIPLMAYNSKELAGFIVLVVFSSLALLALLIFRQSKRKQLAKYRQRERDDYYGPDDYPPRRGGGMRTEPAFLVRPDNEIPSVVRDVDGAVADMGNPAEFAAPANARSPIAPRSAGRSWWPASVAALVIGVAVVLTLPLGGGRAPSAGISAEVIRIDIDGNEVIAVIESPSLAHGQAPSLRSRVSIKKIALIAFVIVAAVLISRSRSCQRRKSPPEFLKRP